MKITGRIMAISIIICSMTIISCTKEEETKNVSVVYCEPSSALGCLFSGIENGNQLLLISSAAEYQSMFPECDVPEIDFSKYTLMAIYGNAQCVLDKTVVCEKKGKHYTITINIKEGICASVETWYLAALLEEKGLTNDNVTVVINP